MTILIFQIYLYYWRGTSNLCFKILFFSNSLRFQICFCLLMLPDSFVKSVKLASNCLWHMLYCFIFFICFNWFEFSPLYYINYFSFTFDCLFSVIVSVIYSFGWKRKWVEIQFFVKETYVHRLIAKIVNPRKYGGRKDF